MQKRVAKDGSKKVAAFFKRNIYYVLMVVCVVAIGTMITVAAVVNKNSGGGNEVIAPPSGGGGEEPADKPVEFILQMPMTDAVMARSYNDSKLLKDETTGKFTTHVGVDFKAAAGTNVVAVFGGVVESVAKDDYYGTTVIIDHKNGYKSTYRLLSDSTLTQGQNLVKGEVIGKVSKVLKYEMAQGEHVHLEVWKGKETVDPMQFMAGLDK